MTKNKYPIYIVSKGRWDSRLTSKALEEMKADYFIVVEQQEYENYASVIDKQKILILPEKYLNEYDTCDDLGRTKSTGPGAARNFCWDDSIQRGFARHWVLDDNIRCFRILNHNTKIKIISPICFRIMEDFVDRYENIALAGPNYFHFAPRKKKVKPLILNTRIYSCILIKNDIPYRWRGRYNEDTDLSLRVLEDRWATVQFYAILQQKAPTQTIKGGNTADFYVKEGTLPKSRMQVKLHPDVSRLTFKFHRWHHQVDYGKYRNNKLIKKPNIEVYNYPIKLINI